jgi:4-amino-4-deoxy-L-arabinose transferase-like glycosyltransferase
VSSWADRPLGALLERRTAHVIALVIVSIAWLFRDMDRPLTGDSVRYAAIARTMAETGRWAVPEMLGEPYFRKPPLGFWAAAASIRALGPTNFAAMLPSTIAAAALVIALYLVVSRAADPLAGLIAALLLLFTPNLYRNSVTCRLESMLLLAALLAIAAVERGRERPRLFAAAWALAGAAILVKSGMGVLPFAVVFFSALALRDPFPFHRPRFWLGALAFAAVVVPWYAVMTQRFGRAFWETHLGGEVLARLGTPHEGRLATLLDSLTYPGLLLFLAPLGVWAARRDDRPAVRRATTIACVWVAVVFAGQLANSSAYARYAYLALAPGAGLAGYGVAALVRRRLSAGAVAGLAGAAGVALLVIQQAGVRLETKWSRPLQSMLATARAVLPEGPVPLIVGDAEQGRNFVAFELGRAAEPLPLDRLAEAGAARREGLLALCDRSGLAAAQDALAPDPEVLADGHYYVVARIATEVGADASADPPARR